MDQSLRRSRLRTLCEFVQGLILSALFLGTLAVLERNRDVLWPWIAPRMAQLGEVGFAATILLVFILLSLLLTGYFALTEWLFRRFLGP
jgi:hypothetical protein